MVKIIEDKGNLVCLECSKETYFLDQPEVNKNGVEIDVRAGNFSTNIPKLMIKHLKSHKDKAVSSLAAIVKLKAKYPKLNKPL